MIRLILNVSGGNCIFIDLVTSLDYKLKSNHACMCFICIYITLSYCAEDGTPKCDGLEIDKGKLITVWLGLNFKFYFIFNLAVIFDNIWFWKS